MKAANPFIEYNQIDEVILKIAIAIFPVLFAIPRIYCPKGNKVVP
jgi:hypothetical protein